MTIQDFSTLCDRTWNTTERWQDQLVNAALGLAGESGEVAEHIKKLRFHGKALDSEGLMLELGDVLYYWATLVRLLGSSFDEIAERNVAKLRHRYPAGFVEVGRD